MIFSAEKPLIDYYYTLKNRDIKLRSDFENLVLFHFVWVMIRKYGREPKTLIPSGLRSLQL